MGVSWELSKMLRIFIFKNTPARLLLGYITLTVCMYGYLTSANENVAHIFTNTAN